MNPKLKSVSATDADKKFSSKENLEDIFHDLLKDIYWAEKHLVSAVPKLVKAAFSESLRDALETHLDDSQKHTQRLEKCFALCEFKPASKKCEAMEGLIKEAMEAATEHERGYARDAALIASIQKIEHYEISSYGTLRTMATVMGKSECAKLLEESKDEEAAMDVKLTKLAERVNQQAVDMIEEKVH